MDIVLDHISKSYQELSVLKDISLSFHSGTAYCLMAPSGFGKTTLLRTILGLETPDTGSLTVTDGARITAVFQEDRLCEDFTPMENVMMVLPGNTPYTRQKIHDELCQLLPEESIGRPVSTLSGGMKRRTAICRALISPFDAVLMDEPFTGLDEDTKKAVVRYILQKTEGKLLLVSTHQEEDVKLLHADLVRLN